MIDIDKFIKPIRSFPMINMVGIYDVCLTEYVRDLENKYKEVVKALIVMGKENTSYEVRHQMCRDLVSSQLDITWEEIKEGIDG